MLEKRLMRKKVFSRKSEKFPGVIVRPSLPSDSRILFLVIRKYFHLPLFDRMLKEKQSLCRGTAFSCDAYTHSDFATGILGLVASETVGNFLINK